MSAGAICASRSSIALQNSAVHTRRRARAPQHPCPPLRRHQAGAVLPQYPIAAGRVQRGREAPQAAEAAGARPERRGAVEALPGPRGGGLEEEEVTPLAASQTWTVRQWGAGTCISIRATKGNPHERDALCSWTRLHRTGTLCHLNRQAPAMVCCLCSSEPQLLSSCVRGCMCLAPFCPGLLSVSKQHVVLNPQVGTRCTT